MQQNKPKLITIDGPSASGKSSVSREVARRLGWSWVSTGAFYRGLAHVAVCENVDLTDTDALVKLSADPIWKVRMDADQTRVLYRDYDISVAIQAEDNGSRASVLSQNPLVRQALLRNQRDCAKGGAGLVAEGRDCGTIVFPEAPLKVYLTASQEERAQRRAREQGLDVQRTQNQQTQRDKLDSSRATAPLQIASDSRVIDSGGMSLSEVIDQVHEWAQEVLSHGVKSF